MKLLFFGGFAASQAEIIGPMIESPVGSVAIRDRLEAFAAAEGLQL